MRCARRGYTSTRGAARFVTAPTIARRLLLPLKLIAMTSVRTCYDFA